MVSEFICGFNEAIKNYPFGLQNCSFAFFVSGSDNLLTNLIPGNLTINSEDENGQYVISGTMLQMLQLTKC